MISDFLVDLTASEPEVITGTLVKRQNPAQKLVFNLITAVAAICNSGAEDIKVLGQALQQEVRGILAEAGMRWVSDEELRLEWPERAIPARGVLSGALGSEWQSLTRKVGSAESEFLNMEIVRVAKRMGRQTPLNEKVMLISKETAANP